MVRLKTDEGCKDEVLKGLEKVPLVDKVVVTPTPDDDPNDYEIHITFKTPAGKEGKNWVVLTALFMVLFFGTISTLGVAGFLEIVRSIRIEPDAQEIIEDL